MRRRHGAMLDRPTPHDSAMAAELNHITWLPDATRFAAGSDQVVLEAALRAGAPCANACRGNARCSTCRVAVEDGLQHCLPRSPAEQLIAERLRLPDCVRLACQLRVRGDVSLRRMILDDDDVALTDLRAHAADPVGEEQRLAVLFADLRGFTAFAAQLPPYDVIHVLNRYFAAMSAAVRAHGGEVNNQMGDGLMALFGPDDDADAAVRAVRAGLAMIAALAPLQTLVRSVYRAELGMGVGIHWGDVVVGTIRAGDTAWRTAIGAAVNLASRIEGANKALGTQMLVSDAVATRAAHAFDVVARHALPIYGLPGVQRLYVLAPRADG